MPSPHEPATAGPFLRIVSFNDVYSLENLPRFASLVRHYAAAGSPDAFLVVLAGDFLAPSMLSSIDRGKGMVECLNAIGVTHVILGNHEDDVPIAELHRRIRELRGTWLGANTRSLDRRIAPHEVIEVTAAGGRGRTVRVGLVGGVMTDGGVYRRAPFGGTKLDDANATVLREASRLLAHERCDVVIPITHQSMDDDRRLASSASAPFPVILGGHEHDVHVEEIGATWLVKAGSDAVRAAIVELRWAPQAPALAPAGGAPSGGEFPTVDVRLEPVAGYPEDAATRALVDAHMRKVHELEDAVLLPLPLASGEALSSVGTRRRQTTMGTMVCSRVRDAMGADACLINGGGIRAGRDYTAHLAYGDVRAELPFDNEMVVARLPGSVLADAVARSRALAPLESGGFLQVDDGVTVTEPESVVTRVAGAPFDPARDYRVVVVRAFFAGMDHIEPFVAFAAAHPERVPPTGSGRELKELLVESLVMLLWQRIGGFDVLDEDRDGVVTEEDVARGIARVTGAPASPTTLTLVMNVVDKNHDRAISRAESEAVAAAPAD